MTSIKELPILFQTEMVQAILEGRKTKTRRTRGLKDINENPNSWNRYRNQMKYKSRFWNSNLEDNPNPLEIAFGFDSNEDESTLFIKSPYGKPGNLLWVRETHKLGAWREDGRMAFDYKSSPELTNTPWVTFSDDFTGDKFNKMARTHTEFLLDNGFESDSNGFFHWERGKSPFKWKPSIHMPKAAARIWLMVEDISVERLKDISEEDAVAEGIKCCINKYNGAPAYFDYSGRIGAQGFNYDTSKESFQTLWKSINGPDSWKQNPWVWVVKFRVLSKTGRPGHEVIREAHRQIID